MTLVECLRSMRELYVRGEYRMQVSDAVVVVDHPGLLMAAAGGDSELADQALALLDKCTPAPGSPFGMFVDGGVATTDAEGRVDFTYRYDVTPAAIAAVIGKALQLALRQVNEHAA